MKKYKCSICKTVNELDLSNKNVYRCPACTRIVRVVETQEMKSKLISKKSARVEIAKPRKRKKRKTKDADQREV